MRKNLYILLITMALFSVFLTGCSKKPAETDSESSTQQESSTGNSSLDENESLQENTTSSEDTSASENTQSSEDSSSPEDTSSSENTTESGDTTVTDTPDDTTVPGDDTTNNNSGSSDNKKEPEDNNNKNNNTNNNTNNNNNTGNNSTGGNVVADKNTDKITESFGGNTSSEEKKLAQAVIDKIITKNMSDFDKAKAIHDYMVINVDYDYDNYLADTIPSASYTALGALKNKYAVCAGYAKAFKLLCELAGLECDYVTGTAGGPHAWNQVKIDSKWYNVDVTWDDPVSKGKQFDDHKYNRYSYFLISDELMYQDHKANNAKHTCSSSLHTKAYEAGAPWQENLYPYVTNDAELSAIAKSAIDANATEISMMWDSNWVPVRDMSAKLKGMMLEYAMSDFSISKYSYVSIPNTTLYSATFYINLQDGKYTAIDKLCTLDDIKELILELKKGNPDQKTVPMANELVNDDIFYKAAVWAFDEHDLSIGFSVTQITINSTTKAVHVHAFPNNYDGSHHANKAYRVKTSAEIKDVMDAQGAGSENFRIVYRYGDELGRLSAEELASYIEKNLAPAWASEYCFEAYELSTDDFVCVTVIKFYQARHSTSGSKWEYTKEPTCIEGGTCVLKCAKCHRVTQSYDAEPTGEHTTSWVYEKDGSKHLGCKHCTYVGPTLYQYGDVWGYYDETAASELFTYLNKNRETAVYYNIDPFGNLIGTETPPQLTLDHTLSKELEAVALQQAYLYNKNTGSSDLDPNIVLFVGKSTSERAASVLTTSNSHMRELFNNKYLTRAGVCCFHFDTDGTGLKMSTVWCIYYGE